MLDKNSFWVQGENVCLWLAPLDSVTNFLPTAFMLGSIHDSNLVPTPSPTILHVRVRARVGTCACASKLSFRGRNIL